MNPDPATRPHLRPDLRDRIAAAVARWRQSDPDRRDLVPHAALIDMDGVLYDSMPGHTRAWKQLADELGIPASREEFYLYEGMTGADTISLIWRRHFGHDCPPDRIHELYERKTRLFSSQGKARPMPYAGRMLRTLSAAGWERVLVTGSGQRSLLSKIDRDYPGAFPADARVTALDVSRGKPDPEPYLKGLSLIGRSPGEAVVIENAPLGVRAGVASGCFTVAVTTGPIPRGTFEKENASIIFSSMKEFAEALPILISEFSSPTVSL